MSWKDPPHSTKDSSIATKLEEGKSQVHQSRQDEADEHHREVLHLADEALLDSRTAIDRALQRIKAATARYEERQRGRS